MCILTDALKYKSYDVYLVPDSMTVLKNTSDTKNVRVSLLKSALFMQLRMEDSYIGIASSRKKPSVILAECGLIDIHSAKHIKS